MEERPTGFPDPETINVTDHALVRWLERRHGLDLTSVRRLASGVTGQAPVNDRTLVRTIEDALLVDMGPLRRQITKEISEGAVAGGPNPYRITTSRGHVAIVSLGGSKRQRQWNVATILTAEMGRQSARATGKVIGVKVRGLKPRPMRDDDLR